MGAKIDDKIKRQNVRLYSLEETAEDYAYDVGTLKGWVITLATFTTLSTILSIFALVIV